MKIYTKTGDTGETGLFGGARVPKDDFRIDALGELDEANAAVGAARATALDADLDAILASAQHGLFDLGAELATPPDANAKAKAKTLLVNEKAVKALEDAIDRLTAELPPQTKFFLPGGHPSAAAIHLARAVVRRAERRIVRLDRFWKDDVGSPLVRAEAFAWINRLSDLLFTMARAANVRRKVAEIEWDPKT